MRTRKAKWHADIVFRDIHMTRGTWIAVYPFNKWEELAEKMEKTHRYNRNAFVASIYIQFNPYGVKVEDD